MRAHPYEYSPLATPNERPRKSRCALCLGLASLVLLVIPVVSFVIYRDSVGETKMTKLINGDPSISLARLDIEYQQREVHCTGSEVLAYLTNAIRAHSGQASQSGTTYNAKFTFNGGGSFTTPFWRFDSGVSWSMPANDGLGERWPNHQMMLPQPMPARVKELLDFLDAPAEQVRGKKLILVDEP